ASGSPRNDFILLIMYASLCSVFSWKTSYHMYPECFPSKDKSAGQHLVFLGSLARGAAARESHNADRREIGDICPE
ncbi:MAG: hypothetical protein ACTSV3_00040, partial [Candidatus Thorarchaeota archaeon]